jgi:hypothetical protein
MNSYADAMPLTHSHVHLALGRLELARVKVHTPITMNANLSLREGSSLVTGRGTYAFTQAVAGLPEGQEARVVNYGTEKQSDWHFSRRAKRWEEMVENQTSYKTAEEALTALGREVG